MKHCVPGWQSALVLQAVPAAPVPPAMHSVRGAAFIGGTQSTEVRQVGMKATERFTQGRISWIEGSHLFPFEQPGQAAAEVLRWLGEFEKASGTTRL